MLFNAHIIRDKLLCTQVYHHWVQKSKNIRSERERERERERKKFEEYMILYRDSLDN